MHLHIGCSGYHYRHWKGLFYPEGLPEHRWFGYYAEHFDTVEINASFYRFPSPSAVARWNRQAPEGFRHCIKAPRLITHLRRMHRCERELEDLARVLEPLEKRLGRVLFQLPPSLHFSEAAMNDIIACLGFPLPAAFEFRHPGWWNDAVMKALASSRHLFCSVHAPGLPDQLVAGQGIYLRMHGIPWYRKDYSDMELAQWAERIRGSHAGEAWIYFNNDFAAAAPRNAMRLSELLMDAGHA